MTRDEVLALPSVVTVKVAAKLVGVGESTARDQIRRGLWPTPVIKLGCQYKLPLEPLLILLGIERDPRPSSEGPPGQVAHAE